MKRIRLAIAAVAIVAMICCLAFAISRPREPKYQGKTLSAWLTPEGVMEDTTEYDRATGNAVRQIGTNAIPWLLKWAEAKDSPLKVKIFDWLSSYRSLNFHPISARHYHLLAIWGFQFLGTNARPAWPTLVKWTYSPDLGRKVEALRCLQGSHPDKDVLLPVLIRLIHDQNRGVQHEAAEDLHYRYPQEAEAAGVYKIFPGMEKQPTYQSEHDQAQLR